MGLHQHWREPLLVNQITMLSCSARSRIVALGSSKQTYSSHIQCSLLSSRGLRALPLNTKPFRSDSRAHRISHRSHVTHAALDITNVPQEALIAGGTGAMNYDPFPSEDRARNIPSDMQMGRSAPSKTQASLIRTNILISELLNTNR